jgi:hypothetical protein
MADKPTPTSQGAMHAVTEGVIPRMGMTIPMPAGTKPPASPTPAGKPAK